MALALPKALTEKIEAFSALIAPVQTTMHLKGEYTKAREQLVQQGVLEEPNATERGSAVAEMQHHWNNTLASLELVCGISKPGGAPNSVEDLQGYLTFIAPDAVEEITRRLSESHQAADEQCSDLAQKENAPALLYNLAVILQRLKPFPSAFKEAATELHTMLERWCTQQQQASTGTQHGRAN